MDDFVSGVSLDAMRDQQAHVQASQQNNLLTSCSRKQLGWFRMLPYLYLPGANPVYGRMVPGY